MGSSRMTTGPGASSARATASRRRSPPESATPSSPTGVSRASGSVATHPSSRAARSAAAISSSVASGRPRVRLDADRAGEHLGPLVRQRVRAPGVALGEALHVGPAEGQCALLEGPIAQERGDEARLAGATRAGDRSPTSGGEAEVDAVEGAGQARPVAEGGVRRRRRRAPPALGRREPRGPRTGTGTSSRAKRRSAEARTASARATASGTPGTVSKVASTARGSTATMTWPRWCAWTAATPSARTSGDGRGEADPDDERGGGGQARVAPVERVGPGTQLRDGVQRCVGRRRRPGAPARR